MVVDLRSLVKKDNGFTKSVQSASITKGWLQQLLVAVGLLVGSCP